MHDVRIYVMYECHECHMYANKITQDKADGTNNTGGKPIS
jgi:hypothetical protein